MKSTKARSRISLIVVAFRMMVCAAAAQASEQVFYFHNDHLGTPQAMSDSTGRKVWEAEYEPFGKATVNQDPDGDGQIVINNLRFPGQYFDAETGLHYNYHRDYDPATGRYLQPDPMAQVRPGWIEPMYAYAGNNPLSNSDPFGLACVGPAGGSTGLAQSYGHKAFDIPRANMLQFHLKCTECEDVTNIHLECGRITGWFDNSKSGGDPAASIYSISGPPNEKWVLAEVRTTIVLLLPRPDIKACYDCQQR